MQKSKGEAGAINKGERRFVRQVLDVCNLLLSVGYEPKDVDPDLSPIELRKQTIVNVVLSAVVELDVTAQAIIWKRYLLLEPTRDFEIMAELGLKRGRYFAIKNTAFIRLAELLRGAQGGERDDEGETEGVKGSPRQTA